MGVFHLTACHCSDIGGESVRWIFFSFDILFLHCFISRTMTCNVEGPPVLGDGDEDLPTHSSRLCYSSSAAFQPQNDGERNASDDDWDNQYGEEEAPHAPFRFRESSSRLETVLLRRLLCRQPERHHICKPAARLGGSTAASGHSTLGWAPV